MNKIILTKWNKTVLKSLSTSNTIIILLLFWLCSSSNFSPLFQCAMHREEKQIRKVCSHKSSQWSTILIHYHHILMEYLSGNTIEQCLNTMQWLFHNVCNYTAHKSFSLLLSSVMWVKHSAFFLCDFGEKKQADTLASPPPQFLSIF